MIIYLVRHGLTVGNVSGFHQTPETPLTKEGISQAEKIAKRLKGKNIDLIYASTHLRAQKTAEIISGAIHAPVESWGELTEIKRPKEIRGKSIEEPETIKIEELLAQNFGNPEWRYSDEENFFDLNIRAEKVLEHLAKNHKDQTVVCVSHGTFIKFLAAKVLFGDKLTPDIFDAFRHHTGIENTGLSIVRFSQERGYRLSTWNDTSHL